MFNLQKFFLILSLFVSPIIAMENNKAIARNKKPIFIPTTNTPQSNHELLNILQSAKNKNTKGTYGPFKQGNFIFDKQDWENIKNV